MSSTHKHASPKLVRRIRNIGGEPLKAIGMGQLCVTTRTSEVLVAYALGSCVALTLYDPVARVGGMLHSPLPDSALDPVQARQRPGMYVDTAVPQLLRMCERVGAVKERMVAHVAGAGAPIEDRGLFQVGRRNFAALRRALWKNDMVLSSTLVGGHVPRTVFLLLDVGETLVRVNGEVLVLRGSCRPNSRDISRRKCR